MYRQTSSMRASIIVIAIACALSACTYDYDALRRGQGAPDSGPGIDAGPRCMSDTECDDGTWCNGDEHCRVGDPAANGFGCVPGIPRCVVTGECIEADSRCGSGCPDGDGDGYEPTSCGGNDCDDGDPRRNPGGTERCDAAGLDEDCNPATFGELDADGDGFFDATCCNGDFCGDDCDDGNGDAHPGAEEVCNSVDDNCNGSTDEGVHITYYADMDHDSHGAPAPTTLACTLPAGYAVSPDDCDDGSNTRYPGAPEACNMIDDDCDGVADDSCM